LITSKYNLKILKKKLITLFLNYNTFEKLLKGSAKGHRASDERQKYTFSHFHKFDEAL